MKFKYNQSLLIKTEYVEALALYYYCKFNNLDFEKEISKRKKKDLNNFPDFAINSTFLEVTRAIDQVEGKQQKDITDVFGKHNTAEIVSKKNKELEKFKGKNSHHIKFGVQDGIAYAIPDLRNYHSLVDRIKNAVNEKYEKYKSRIIENELDLFVISYNCIDDESIDEIFNWYKNNKELTNFFANVYVRYLSQDNENPVYVVKMNKSECINKPVDCTLEKNELAEIIFKLGWIDENDYLK